jgi:hypothetical protein
LVAATPTPINLQFPAASVVNLSGDISSETIYKVTVPANESLLTLSTSGGSGDVDLYLRKGTVGCSTLATAINPCRWDSRSAAKGNNEKITVTNPGAADYYLDIVGIAAYNAVNLTMSTGPGLAVSPTSLSFTATAGGAAPETQTLKITERSGGNLVWTAQAQGGTWLKISPTDGDGTTPMTVSVVTTGLAVGTYAANIVVTSPGVAASPQTIPVKLAIQ